MLPVGIAATTRRGDEVQSLVARRGFLAEARAAGASLGNIRILGAVLKAWQGREGNKADKTEKAKHAF